MKEEKKIVEKGTKVGVERCPKCNDEIVIEDENGTEVFICKNCKFKIEK